MNNTILNTEVQQFINANLSADLHALLMKKTPFAGVSMQQIVQQIKGKKVAQKKFPFLLKDGIVFPPNLNLEQASSQTTAVFKGNNLKGKTFLDLTCGFGIDAYFLSQNFEEVTVIEQNSQLLETVKHNWRILDKKACFLNENLEDFLSKNIEIFDVIYLDPARRDSEKNKKFLLEDLSPDLLEIQNKLFEISGMIIIKLSPLIDLSYLISVLKNITKIQIIAVRNEVKELIVFLEKDYRNEDVEISCVNLESEDAEFCFHFRDEKRAFSHLSEPQRFLYIPNNSVLKSGAFNLISQVFKCSKLNANTHLYTSEVRINDFPGRILEIEIIDSKSIAKGDKYNIISKNYPLSPDEIKKKYRISDGGNRYLIFTQTENRKIILKSQ